MLVKFETGIKRLIFFKTPIPGNTFWRHYINMAVPCQKLINFHTETFATAYMYFSLAQFRLLMEILSPCLM